MGLADSFSSSFIPGRASGAGERGCLSGLCPHQCPPGGAKPCLPVSAARVASPRCLSPDVIKSVRNLPGLLSTRL